MTFTVIVEADAEQDWHEAVMFYDEREPGVSHRLNVALREMLNTLAHQPERFLRATPKTRKAKVPPPWPYSIYFTVNVEHCEVKILAVWHGSRNPAELRRRLKRRARERFGHDTVRANLDLTNLLENFSRDHAGENKFAVVE